MEQDSICARPGEPDRQQPDWGAITGVALTIATHIAIKLVSDKPSVPFIAGASAFWFGFVLVRARQNKQAFRNWGFRADNLWPASAAAGIVFVAGLLALGGYAKSEGSLDFPLHTLVLFLIYPIWGVIQQFLALGIFFNNLEQIDVLRRRRLLLVVGTAAIFGLIHFYDWRLAAATFAFELIAIPLYQRFRNLWPLGILQGWLGALFYLWVLHEDLWLETLRR